MTSYLISGLTKHGYKSDLKGSNKYMVSEAG